MKKVLALSLLAGSALVLTAGAASAFNPDTLVTVGSPQGPLVDHAGTPVGSFAQNKQNEPALTVDANHPNVLAAGSNDEIDLELCNAGDPTTCPFTSGVGVSGIYFSFDSGTTWTQPTYSGWSARDCVGPEACAPHVGDIGTLPKYYENGLVSDGDPARAFGPKPGSNGKFAWANGSRLYYANLTSNFSDQRSEAQFKGFEAVAVSRTDNVAAAAAGSNDAWLKPVIVSNQNSALFSDKEQNWADNAQTSPFFGNVYVCSAAFRGQQSKSQPLLAATSRDGGNTWTTKQVTPATNNTHSQNGFGRSGCAIRTDSNGVVYLFAEQFAFGFPGTGYHLLIKSFDGGKTWTKQQRLFTAVDTCNAFDEVIGRCVEDGVAGARDDLGPAPNVDIANGAPTGIGATNEIVDTWVDGRDGLNHEHVKFTYSTSGGSTWAPSQNVETAGDRGYYSAPAISPTGTDVYLAYNAFTTPYRDNTSDPRELLGVVKHADVAANGTVGAFAPLHRGAVGDPRGTGQNGLTAEFLGDYIYAVATPTYGAAVWNDARNADDCPALDAWRMSLRTADTSDDGPTPAPNTDCLPRFGNSDIFGGSYPDPTP
jgi:hypothetical protein